jgi:hypothetical protein
VKLSFPVLTACTLVLLVSTDVAVAQTATNVNCSSCISNGEIANNAVTSEKIVNGSVTVNDLAAGSVKAATIVNGSVTSAKLAPSVRGALNDALANLTTVAVEDATVGIAEAACPSGRIPVSASCLCDDNNGINNFGVLFACVVDGNGAIAACFDEAETFNPTKDSPVAIVQAVCLGGESSDGTPWVPTAAGLAPAPASSEANDEAVATQAQWHQEQHAALQSKVAELRARRARHRSLLLD